MKPKITLHVGTGKTGTSAMQVTLARNHHVLKENGVLYPEHHSFHRARSGHVTSGNIEPQETWFKDQVMGAVSANPGYAKYIFSSEYLCWRMDSFLENYSNYCSDYDFEVILSVRNPFEMLNASYQQVVKRHGFFLRIGDYAPRAVAFRRAAKVASELEARNIPYKLFNYSAIRSDIVKRIFTHLGLWELVEHDAAKVGVINRSMTAAELNFIRYVNQIFGHEYAVQISDELIKRLPGIAGDILPIDEEARRDVYAANEEAVRYFNARLPITEQLNLEPPKPSVALDSQNVLSPEQIEIIRGVLLSRLNGATANVAAAE